MKMEGIDLMALGLWASFTLVLMSGAGVEAYQNYTVGDNLGWYDNIMKPTVNYAKWAVGKNFSLGDFLIFNTDTNHTVVQTYNQTTYTTCDVNDDSDDVIEWSNSEPSANARPTTVSVPLEKEGMNYFFSSDYDGWQCAKGQKFQINVTYGQGLPAALRVPPAAPAAPSPDDSTDVPAITNVPAVTGPVADTTPDTTSNTASASDPAVRIDGLFVTVALTVLCNLAIFIAEI